MKLYFSPGACSFSPHIVLLETGLPFELERVNLKEHRTEGGTDYYAVNPKGYVPALKLDDGQVLTEGPAIVQYLADRKPESKLAPPAGTFERYRLQEWLNFISTEIHKGFSPLFRATTPDAYKTIAKENLSKRFEFLAKHLEANSFLMGSTFTVADAYLFTVLGWAPGNGLDLTKWPPLKAYTERIATRPSVKAAQEAERPARQPATGLK